MATSSSSSTTAATIAASCGRTAGWEWRLQENVTHPAFWTESGGRWFWRGMFEDFPLPLAWPVYVSQAEADAYARWRGRRLPTEAEYHRAAFGTPDGVERTLPWGRPHHADRRDARERRFHGLGSGAGRHAVRRARAPGACTIWSGNGWEWTSTVFAPFPGFGAMPSYPEYSAEFFDGQHFVMKGASPATAQELMRRSFRNWFRPNYPYVYAKFRTAGAVTTTTALDRRRLPRDVAATCADAEAAAVAIPLRRAGIEPVRSDLPAAVVSHHPRGSGVARARTRRRSRRCRRASDRSRSSSSASAAARSSAPSSTPSPGAASSPCT